MRAPLGPVMADVQGLALDSTERAMLGHPLVGGVILFARNFASSAQLRRLTSEISALRDPALAAALLDFLDRQTAAQAQQQAPAA